MGGHHLIGLQSLLSFFCCHYKPSMKKIVEEFSSQTFLVFALLFPFRSWNQLSISCVTLIVFGRPGVKCTPSKFISHWNLSAALHLLSQPGAWTTIQVNQNLTLDKLVPYKSNIRSQISIQWLVKQNSFHEKGFIHTTFLPHSTLIINHSWRIKTPLSNNFRQISNPTGFYFQFSWVLDFVSKTRIGDIGSSGLNPNTPVMWPPRSLKILVPLLECWIWQGASS